MNFGFTLAVQTEEFLCRSVHVPKLKVLVRYTQLLAQIRVYEVQYNNNRGGTQGGGVLPDCNPLQTP